MDEGEEGEEVVNCDKAPDNRWIRGVILTPPPYGLNWGQSELLYGILQLVLEGKRLWWMVGGADAVVMVENDLVVAALLRDGL